MAMTTETIDRAREAFERQALVARPSPADRPADAGSPPGVRGPRAPRRSPPTCSGARRRHAARWSGHTIAALRGRRRRRGRAARASGSASGSSSAARSPRPAAGSPVPARLSRRTAADRVERLPADPASASRSLGEGDAAGALRAFEAGCARSPGGSTIPTSPTLSRLRPGRLPHPACGKRERGVALLDEAMVAVTSGEVSPIIVGIVYCASIESFQQVFDLAPGAGVDGGPRLAGARRQPDVVPFRGRCLVYRAELMVLTAQWDDADRGSAAGPRLLLAGPPRRARRRGGVLPAGRARPAARVVRRRGERGLSRGAWSRPPARARPGAPSPRAGPAGRRRSRRSVARSTRRDDPRPRRASSARTSRSCVAAGDAGGGQRGRRRAGSASPRTRTTAARRARSRAPTAPSGWRPATPVAPSSRSAARWRPGKRSTRHTRRRGSASCIALACRALGDEDGRRDRARRGRAVFADARRRARPRPGPPMPSSDARWQAARRLDRARDRGPAAPRRPAGRTGRSPRELVISERTVDRHVSNIFTKLDVSIAAPPRPPSPTSTSSSRSARRYPWPAAPIDWVVPPMRATGRLAPTVGLATGDPLVASEPSREETP